MIPRFEPGNTEDVNNCEKSCSNSSWADGLVFYYISEVVAAFTLKCLMDSGG